MIPYLFNIGPFYCNCYGLAIILGVWAFVHTIARNQRFKSIISTTELLDLIGLTTLVAITGSRILYIILHPSEFDTWTDYLTIWQGGLSVLGGILATIAIIPWYLRARKIAILPLMDMAAAHVPLLHSIARLGCFCAGCCCGAVTSVAWAITYCHPDSSAPLGIPLHPAQLYSSFSLLGIYILMRYVLQPHLIKPGQLASCYLILTGIERAINELFRAEYTPHYFNFLSSNQTISLALIAVGIIFFIISSYNRSHEPV